MEENNLTKLTNLTQPFDGSSATPISDQMEAKLQSQCGLPRTRRRMLDSVQRVASPPARALDGSLARGEVEFVVGGAKVVVEVERQPRPRGGAQGYWRCPRCDRRCCSLFVIGIGSLLCRKCAGLDYRSRHVLHPALTKAAKLRKRIGAQPGVLSKLPKRRPHWRRDYWARTVAQLAEAERVLVDMLNATVRAAERQKARADERR